LYAHVIYRCVVGSRAYGLDHDESDIDLRGIYLPRSNCTGRCSASRSSWNAARKPTGRCRSSSCWR
jgi:predicted nucleotidyltransferase